MSKAVAIIQARMGSTRLPGKVLLDLAGRPLIAWSVDRLRRAQTIDQVVVATTTRPADNAIESVCALHGWPCFRGSEDDVLDRYYQAALAHHADTVVRVTADCPLVEPEIVDRVLETLLDSRLALDYASNVLPPRTFPRGLDVEVMRFAALERAWTEDRNPACREHVTPYLYRHPELFRLQGIFHTPDLSHHRWTVDTLEDLALIRTICDYLGGDRFSWRDILAAFDAHPEWVDINRHVTQKQS